MITLNVTVTMKKLIVLCIASDIVNCKPILESNLVTSVQYNMS